MNRHWFLPVRYYDKYPSPFLRRWEPESVAPAFYKGKRFEHEKEIRFVVETGKSDDPYWLSVGDLSDISLLQPLGWLKENPILITG